MQILWMARRKTQAFRMRDHIAQCAQVDPTRRAEMSQLIAFKEAAAAAKQEEKAGLATAIVPPLPPPLPWISSALLPRNGRWKTRSIRNQLSRSERVRSPHMITANGFVLIANGTTDIDGRCNTLLPANSRPEIGIYKVTS
ncbi:hypothetical protein KEM48_002255 [Puccinia striiformis f. sp. tritici PST-130]|nr:hypothetical protein KEM48_002255 [Puccinia striiformis f. sp. tritici PST-130]